MSGEGSGAPRAASRRVASIAKAAITTAAAYLALRRIDGAELAATLAAVAAAPAAAAFGLYLAGQLITAWRWHLIAHAIGLGDGFGRTAVFYFVGMFFNHVGPSTLGGDLVRALYLGAPSGRRRAAVATVVVDRFVGLAALLAIATLALAVFGGSGLPRSLIVVTVVLTVALPLAWRLAPVLVEWLPAAESRLRGFLHSEIGGGLSHNRRLLGRLVAVSLVFHGVQIVAAMAVGRAVGLDVAPAYYLVFHPLVAVLAALPVSVAGLGVRELGYVYFLADLAAVDDQTALAFAVVWLALVLGASAVGGVVFWLSGIGLPALGGAAADSAPHSSEDSTQFPPAS